MRPRASTSSPLLIVPPLDRWCDLVESEDVEPEETEMGVELAEFPQELGWLVSTRKDQPPHRSSVLAQKPHGGADSDPTGDADQLDRVGHAGDSHFDRQFDPIHPDPFDPGFDAGDVEAHLGGDVCGVSLLVDQRLTEKIPGDEWMTFGIAGDADIGEIVPYI